MTIIEDAKKYLHEKPTAYMTKERRLEKSAVLIEKLVKEIEQYQAMKFNVGELLSAVTEGHRADALFELKHDYEALSQLEDK